MPLARRRPVGATANGAVITEALEVLARVEQRVEDLPRRRQGFEVRGDGRAYATEELAVRSWDRLAPGRAVRSTDGVGGVVAPIAAVKVEARRKPDTGRLRLRAFYDDPEPLTLFAHEADREGRVRAAVEALGRLSGRTPFAIPEIREAGSVGGHDFALETRIRGHHAYDEDSLRATAQRLLPGLAAMYEAVGVERRPLGKCLDLARLRGRLTDLLAAEELAPPEWIVHRFDAVMDAVDTDAAVPVSLTHGDVVFGNVLRTDDDGLALIDWELAGDGAVLFDVAKLVGYSPGPVEHGLMAAEQLDALGAGFLPGRTQVAVGLLHYAGGWAKLVATAPSQERLERRLRRVRAQLRTAGVLLGEEDAG